MSAFARFTRVLLAAMVMVFGAGAALAQSFSVVFDEDTIGPGSTSRMTFTIDNTGFPTAMTGAAFTGALPAGLTFADASLDSNCSRGTVSAPAGGTTITLSEGQIAGGAACDISVNVRGATPGAYVFLSGDLTSSAGNAGTATDTLTIDGTLPGFSKALAPASINFGGTSTLT